ncbi:baseplate wedge subunit [Synechococcus phage DSL-LC03]|nr:baseplate wedge subunit [Synechococcus phage DSL-LC03]
MAAIISDQFRILNAETFMSTFTGIGSTNYAYYTFIGVPNPYDTMTGTGTTDWNDNPPSPQDMLKALNDAHDTMISLKKINPADLRRVVRKLSWSPGTTFEMYREDYNVYNPSPITNSNNLYDANYYVVNSEFRVYICLNNGTNPENPLGSPSIDEPLFTDLEPRAAGTSGDGYIWKYLYTISPKDIIKFDSTEYIPVPENWGTGESEEIKNNAVDGKVQVIIIENRGDGYQPISTSIKNVPILGDGRDGKATITIDSSGKVSDIAITNGGRGYTYGNIQFYPGAPGSSNGAPIQGLNSVGVATTSVAQFKVVIPPTGGHGANVYKELGANKVLIYSRYEVDVNNPDTIVGNDFARVGVIKNPTLYGSTTQLLTASEYSSLYALKLTSPTASSISGVEYDVDSVITQTIGIGSTAIGIVASWDNTSGVLKYYQPVGLASTSVGFKLCKFTSEIGAGGTTVIQGATVGTNLVIDTTFGTVASPANSTIIGSGVNTRTVKLGQNYIEGCATPENEKYSGEVIYIDNRAAIIRSPNQKEDVKIILEF